MRKPRVDGQATKKQLLISAGEVFAVKGFQNATLAEICANANANIAAANYYFGNKETLYVKSWRFAFEQSLKAHPPDGNVPPNASKEERLHGRILAIMRRIIDPGNHDLDIIFKEMVNPTGLLDDVIHHALEPTLSGLTTIIRELLGPQATEQQVQLCLLSIRSQCFGPLMRARRRKLNSSKALPGDLHEVLKNVEILAAHVTGFSLAGIRAVRDESD